MQYLGHISRQPLLDNIFSYLPPAGPFPSVGSFHDWFTNLSRPHRGPDDPPHPAHPMRSLLPNDELITFTHGDLHRTNIIVSPEGEGAPRVLAIIDWHQSGWFPAYWESCKARWTAIIGDEWVTEYLPRILKPCMQYDYWDYFVLNLGV